MLPITPDTATLLPILCDLLDCTLGRSLFWLSFEILPLVTLGEHDCLLGLLLAMGASLADRAALGAPGLPLVAEGGRSGIVVLKFGGASSEKPGIAAGCQGCDFKVGELPREGAEFLEGIEVDFPTEEERAGGGPELLWLRFGVDGRLVGVEGLDDGLVAGSVDLVAGSVDLDVGVEGLDAVIEALDAEIVGLDVGVEGLDAVNEDLDAGAAGLDAGATGLDADTAGLDAGTADLDAGTAAIDEGTTDLEVGVEGLDET